MAYGKYGTWAPVVDKYDVWVYVANERLNAIPRARRIVGIPPSLLEEPDEDTGLNERLYMMEEFCHDPRGEFGQQITHDAFINYVREADALIVHTHTPTATEPVVDPNDRSETRAKSFALGYARRTQFVVDALCVHPADRGTGEGRAMVEILKSFARANGCTSIYLSSLPTSKPFYEKLGFTSIAGTDDFELKLGGARGRTFRRKTVRRNKYGSRLARKSQHRIRNRHA